MFPSALQMHGASSRNPRCWYLLLAPTLVSPDIDKYKKQVHPQHVVKVKKMGIWGLKMHVGAEGRLLSFANDALTGQVTQGQTSCCTP
jgi:hypothetical protein